MSGHEPGAGGTKFDPTRHLRQLRGRGGTADYLDVKWRLVWLRSEHPDALITTEHITITAELAVFKAQVSIPGAGSATGHGSETAKDFGDFIEKAETKALGRALLALGYGTQFAQEFGEDESLDVVPAVRAMPARAEPTRPEGLPARQSPAPQAATAPRPPIASAIPRAEPIPADARRPAPVRPLREAESDSTDDDAPETPSPPIVLADDDNLFDTLARPAAPPVSAAPAPVPRAPQRPNPPPPAPRPLPTPAFTREPAEDVGEDEVIDMANYGWTEFWSWARALGFNDRKSLDAVVGRPTNGMTPLEIRKQIQAKQ